MAIWLGDVCHRGLDIRPAEYAVGLCLAGHTRGDFLFVRLDQIREQRIEQPLFAGKMMQQSAFSDAGGLCHGLDRNVLQALGHRDLLRGV